MMMPLTEEGRGSGVEVLLKHKPTGFKLNPQSFRQVLVALLQCRSTIDFGLELEIPPVSNNPTGEGPSLHSLEPSCLER